MTKNELQKGSFLVFKRVVPMIELPDDLGDEEIEPVPPHTSDAGQLSLQDAPEALDVVRVNVTADVFALQVIDESVPEAALLDAAVHLEPVRQDDGTGHHPFPEHLKDEPDIEFFRFHEDDDRPRCPVEDAEYRQFVGPMPVFSLDAADVQAFVLPLSTDVRLVHLDRTDEGRGGVARHDPPQMMRHALGGLHAHRRLGCHASSSTFPKKGPDRTPPCIRSHPESRNGIGPATELSSTLLAFSFLPSQEPRATETTERTGSLPHIWWQTYLFLWKGHYCP